MTKTEHALVVIAIVAAAVLALPLFPSNVGILPANYAVAALPADGIPAEETAAAPKSAEWGRFPKISKYVTAALGIASVVAIAAVALSLHRKRKRK